MLLGYICAMQLIELDRERCEMYTRRYKGYRSAIRYSSDIGCILYFL